MAGRLGRIGLRPGHSRQRDGGRGGLQQLASIHAWVSFECRERRASPARKGRVSPVGADRQAFGPAPHPPTEAPLRRCSACRYPTTCAKHHEANPYSVNINGTQYSIQYDPGDSTSDFFGGNSNWRGPVWMPINYLIIQSIKKFGEFYDDSLTIEYPTGSGVFMELSDVANELVKRIITLFELDEKNNRRLHGDQNWFYSLPENKNLILFYEYFHGYNGRGLGAANQIGWTVLVAELINEPAEKEQPVMHSVKSYE